jgi:hypothetical protein
MYLRQILAPPIVVESMAMDDNKSNVGTIVPGIELTETFTLTVSIAT